MKSAPVHIYIEIYSPISARIHLNYDFFMMTLFGLSLVKVVYSQKLQLWTGDLDHDRCFSAAP